jgi:hypothetical protein
MSRLRTITTQSPAIVISTVALVFSLGAGAGAGYAATVIQGNQIAPHSIQANRLVNHSIGATQLSPQLPATKIAFHRLKLINGWQSSQNAFDTGNPAYGIRDGIVYLSGSVHQAKVGNTEFAVLPKGARPTHDLYLTVYTFQGTTGTLRVEPNGQLLAISSTNTASQDYTSLAAVCFPVNS